MWAGSWVKWGRHTDTRSLRHAALYFISLHSQHWRLAPERDWLDVQVQVHVRVRVRVRVQVSLRVLVRVPAIVYVLSTPNWLNSHVDAIWALKGNKWRFYLLLNLSSAALRNSLADIKWSFQLADHSGHSPGEHLPGVAGKSLPQLGSENI